MSATLQLPMSYDYYAGGADIDAEDDTLRLVITYYAFYATFIVLRCY